MHRSNAVLVTDEEQVREAIEAWRRRGWFESRFEISGGRLAFFGYTDFSVYDDRSEGDLTRDFLSDIQEFVDGVLVIRTVGYEGLRYLPDTSQWVVTPDKIYNEDLPGPGEVEIGTDEIIEGS